MSINVIVSIDMSSHANLIASGRNENFEFAQSCTEYEVAIQAVMEILQEYDSDQLFPAFGFGAKMPSGGKLAHKFPLNGEPNNCHCKGMTGVLTAYKRCLTELHSTGPICFGPTIRDVSEAAKRSKTSENYYVLLILTNGTVDDWIETKKAVIETSFLPISIIVIGVGGGKFSEMEILDQDFGLLKVGQEQACRDNVQFVQMRRFLRLAADGTDSLRWSKVALAKEVLAELPSQILEYLDKNHLTPCHLAPRQPDNLSDLTNPDWWRRFTQPLCTEESQLNQQSTIQLQRIRISETDQKRPNPQQPQASSSSFNSVDSSFFLGPNDHGSSSGSGAYLNDYDSGLGTESATAPRSPKPAQGNLQVQSSNPTGLYRQLSLNPASPNTESNETKPRFKRVQSGMDHASPSFRPSPSTKSK